MRCVTHWPKKLTLWKLFYLFLIQLLNLAFIIRCSIFIYISARAIPLGEQAIKIRQQRRILKYVGVRKYRVSVNSSNEVEQFISHNYIAFEIIIEETDVIGEGDFMKNCIYIQIGEVYLKI
ncbi:MAG: hypothetical protein EZS28_016375 [Streblomastix strix]|uniref:Uncharacterized protein n=1 Tax=Streblomastix strix TaxID=222440 RepID=A0A5J4VZU0_9EUKA|nr:MAG: hypothetical protein EZS28_016375 [Streblomastix strix]